MTYGNMMTKREPVGSGESPWSDLFNSYQDKSIGRFLGFATTAKPAALEKTSTDRVYDTTREETPDWLNEKISAVAPDNVSAMIALLLFWAAVAALASIF